MMRTLFALLPAILAAVACSEARATPAQHDEPTTAPSLLAEAPLANPFAMIPPECYVETRGASAEVAHSCATCHARPTAPNFVDDEALQIRLDFPAQATKNPWRNFFEPATSRVTVCDEAALLASVRESNYFDDLGHIVLATRLRSLPASWDAEGDRRWNGFVPDAYFRFDDRGFDLGPDGTRTGWRAYAYDALPGTLSRANGAVGDALIRLPPAFRQDDAEHDDPLVAEVNLAIVESLVTRADVPIVKVDEARFGVDLNLDGTIGPASRVRFHGRRDGTTRQHYVGRARVLEARGDFAIAPGLFPLGTEFLHTLRYLDVQAGHVVAARRFKEVRYAKKTRWLRVEDLRAKAAADVAERAGNPTYVERFPWQFDRGIFNGRGWLLQAFIEDREGALRPQTHEETVACAGCHGGIGVTTDSNFSFARKRRTPSGGWFHALTGPGEDAPGTNVFGPEHALAATRAYRAVVLEQSYTRGRDPHQEDASRLRREVIVGEKTGVAVPLRMPTVSAHAPRR